jgi:hypothetical protein
VARLGLPKDMTRPITGYLTLHPIAAVYTVYNNQTYGMRYLRKGEEGLPYKSAMNIHNIRQARDPVSDDIKERFDTFFDTLFLEIT